MNILLVSIAFPPKRDPEALQVAKYLAALSCVEGVRIDVVTSASPTLAMPVDDSLRRYLPGCRQLIEVAFFENRYVNFALGKLLPGLLLRPDSRARFWKNWKAAARKLQAKPDVIYSRSFPLSSTMMGYELARHFGAPWVLHLSDPWTLSPLHSIAGARRWNEQAEQKCFDAAAAITVTSQKTADLYARRYPGHAGKFKVFPNVYEQEAVAPNPWAPAAKLRLVYTGSLIGTRSPAPVIAALDRLASAHPDVRQDVEVIFAGLCDRENARLLARSTPGLRYLGNIPLAQAISEQRSADVLLLIDSAFGSSDAAVFFPSKLLDYVAARRRTIAITDLGSASWDAVGELGLGDCVTHDDIEGLCRAIVSAWSAWKGNDRAYFERTGEALRLEAGYNARRLVDLFRDVQGARGPAQEVTGGCCASVRPLPASMLTQATPSKCGDAAHGS